VHGLLIFIRLGKMRLSVLESKSAGQNDGLSGCCRHDCTVVLIFLTMLVGCTGEEVTVAAGGHPFSTFLDATISISLHSTSTGLLSNPWRSLQNQRVSG